MADTAASPFRLSAPATEPCTRLLCSAVRTLVFLHAFLAVRVPLLRTSSALALSGITRLASRVPHLSFMLL